MLEGGQTKGKGGGKYVTLGKVLITWVEKWGSLLY